MEATMLMTWCFILRSLFILYLCVWVCVVFDISGSCHRYRQILFSTDFLVSFFLLICMFEYECELLFLCGDMRSMHRFRDFIFWICGYFYRIKLIINVCVEFVPFYFSNTNHFFTIKIKLRFFRTTHFQNPNHINLFSFFIQEKNRRFNLYFLPI